MDATLWKRAQELFHELVEVDDGERARALDGACEGAPELRALVDGMLAADRRDETLIDSPVPELLDGGHAGSDPAGLRFGAYEAVELIGAGGMGDVLRARRVDGAYDKDVAIKLLKPGFAAPGIVQRFLLERQTLARLEHESIARLLDGGTTADGRPYLVMELVDGEPIDQFCDGRRLATRERLELFVRVCDAVEHAHGQGVVHRDLKPGNILIRGDGSPRLVDFGIARLVDRTDAKTLTSTGSRLYTPDYASPEQVRGGTIGYPTDVWALGVVLYELLVGVRPFSHAASQHDLERAICEEDPTWPSRAVGSAEAAERVHVRGSQSTTLRRELSGDLDAIVLRCLAGDPRRRYGSVAKLADDVRRHLDGRPIRARRPGVAERAWRWTRRHPVTVVAGLAVVAVVVTGAMAWLARGETEQTLEELGRVLDETEQTQEELAAARVEATRTRAELLASAETLLESVRVLRAEGQVESARRTAEAVLADLVELGEGGTLRAETLKELALSYLLDGLPHEAEPLLEEALPLVPDEDIVLKAKVLNHIAYTRSLMGRTELARQSADEALAFCREHLPAGHEILIDSLRERASQHRRALQFGAAIELLVEGVQTASADRGRNDPDVGACVADIGLVLLESRDIPRAIEHLELALDILGLHYGAAHPGPMQVMANLGVAHKRLGQLDESESVQRRLLELRVAHYGERHPRVADSLHFVAGLLHEAERHDEAVLYYRAALELREALLAPEDPAYLQSVYERGIAEAEVGNVVVADLLLSSALARGRLGPAEEATARYYLGGFLLAEGCYEEAEESLRLAYELGRTSWTKPGRTEQALGKLHGLYVEWGRLDEAAKVLPPQSSGH